MKRAAALDRDWQLMSDVPCLEVEALLKADKAAGSVQDELRLAVALRSIGARVEPADIDEEWEAFEGLRAEKSLTVVPPYRRRSRRTAVAVLLAAALSVASLAGGALAAAPGTPLYGLRRALERVAVAVAPGSEAQLRVADARLDDLINVLNSEDEQLAVGAAVDLVEARVAAIDAGADVSGLDEHIRGEVPPALASVAPETRDAVLLVLSGLLDPLPGASPPGSEQADASGKDDASGAGDDGDGTGVGAGGAAGQDGTTGEGAGDDDGTGVGAGGAAGQGGTTGEGAGDDGTGVGAGGAAGQDGTTGEGAGDDDGTGVGAGGAAAN